MYRPTDGKSGLMAENSGTEEKLRDFEAIQIELKDSLADQYDIYYWCMRRRICWLGWAKNGEKAERKVLQKIGSYSDRTGGKRWSSTWKYRKTFIKK